MNVFDGLYGYEEVMLVCGFVLFVFTLAAITVMLAQRRSMKALTTLLAISIVMMGFPGIQTIRFSKDMVEVDNARHQPPTEMSDTQKQKYADALANVQARSAGQPLVQAKVADGYRAIGKVDKAYDLAQSVLAAHPTNAARKVLVPVLTAKLEQATPPASAAATAPVSSAQRQAIAHVATQLQAQATQLPADSHLALAKAYASIGDTRLAKANVEAAKRIDPNTHVSPSLQVLLHHPPVASAGGGH